MANNYYGLVKIEFSRKGETALAVTGSDCVIRVDGRFSKARAYGEVEAIARKYVAAYPSLEWNGIIYKFSNSKYMLVTSKKMSFLQN